MQTNLFVTGGNKERLQRGRNGKVEFPENFLKWLLKLDHVFSASSAVYFGDDKFIKADFILKCYTHCVGSTIRNLVSRPDNPSVFARRKQVAVCPVGGIQQADIIASAG